MFKRLIFIFSLLLVSTFIFAQQQAMNKQTLSFHQAIRRGDINEMEKLLKKNKDKIDLKAFPYLATDVGIANIEITKFLINNGADVNAQTEYGTTPLMWAVRFHYIDTVKLLLENGANKTINAKELGTRGDTALSLALNDYRSYKDKVRIIIAILLENGADLNMTAGGDEFTFISAISDGDFDFVELLLKNGMNLKKHSPGYLLKIARGYGGTNIEMIKLLMAYGVKPEYDLDSNSLLQEICRSRDIQDREVLELFINNGLDVNSYTDDNWSLLIAALETKNFDTARILINNNAIVNCVVKGTTPLITAIRNAAPADMIKTILDNGADPNTIDISRKTALDYAKNRGDNTIINLIQERM